MPRKRNVREKAEKKIKRFGGPNSHDHARFRATLLDGGSTGAITNMEFAASLGQIIGFWPHLEDRMIFILRSLIGNPEFEGDIPSQQIFRAIVSQDARIRMMRAMLEQSPINRDKGAIYDAIIDEFEALNKARNNYVHGLWWTHESGRMFLQPASPSEFGFLDQREVVLQEMHDVINRMSQLFRRIIHLQIGLIQPPTGPTRPEVTR